jgi:hypothetical protein
MRAEKYKPNEIRIGKEGVLAVTTNNDPRIFRTAPRIKDVCTPFAAAISSDPTQQEN